MSENPKLFEQFIEPASGCPQFSTEITLRDLFAAAVLCGLSSVKLSEAEMAIHKTPAGILKNYSTNAYLMADAMLAERSKP